MWRQIPYRTGKKAHPTVHGKHLIKRILRILDCYKSWSCVFHLIYVSVFLSLDINSSPEKFTGFYVSESQQIFRSNTGHHISVCTPAPHREVSSLSVTQQWKTQNLSFGGNLSTVEHSRHLQDEEGLEVLKAQNRHKAFLSGWTSDGFSSLCDQLPWRAC